MHTIVNAAFADFIFGRNVFSAFGAAGGRAAVWGAAASGDNEEGLGTTTGGESARGGWERWGRSRERSAEIMARRTGLREGAAARRARWKREDMLYCLRLFGQSITANESVRIY